ncbi:hypothetical protein ACFL1I_00105 [Candidatus Omnitrophota bacterium]
MNKCLLLGCLITALAFLPGSGLADQLTEDVFASVIVTPTFNITVDNDFLDFGLVNPGESATLKPASHFNTVSFISNKARKYYLKITIHGDISGPKGARIPDSSVKWKVVRASGSGVAVNGWQEFSDQPLLVYTSSAEDATGAANKIDFQYRLDLPPQASGGNYSLQLAYSLTEEK